MDRILEMDLRLVVLGTGDEEYRVGLTKAQKRHPGRFGLHIGFDERLAHLIEAGSDMFLMPSRYEPCGLNQMYSLLYGAVPVVRATGGLADTVVDLDEDPERANGFVFRAYHQAELLKTVRRAVRMFQDRKAWREMMIRGMETDFSWKRSAFHYLAVYRAATSEVQRAA
jgi:starch synthase